MQSATFNGLEIPKYWASLPQGHVVKLMLQASSLETGPQQHMVDSMEYTVEELPNTTPDVTTLKTAVIMATNEKCDTNTNLAKAKARLQQLQKRKASSKTKRKA